MERFAKIDQRLYAVNYFRSILDIWQRSEYASAYICNYVTPAIKILKSVTKPTPTWRHCLNFSTLSNFFFKGVFQTSWYKELL